MTALTPFIVVLGAMVGTLLFYLWWKRANRKILVEGQRRYNEETKTFKNHTLKSEGDDQPNKEEVLPQAKLVDPLVGLPASSLNIPEIEDGKKDSN